MIFAIKSVSDKINHFIHIHISEKKKGCWQQHTLKEINFEKCLSCNTYGQLSKGTDVLPRKGFRTYRPIKLLQHSIGITETECIICQY
jgi:hypothetical protein